MYTSILKMVVVYHVGDSEAMQAHATKLVDLMFGEPHLFWIKIWLDCYDS
jgi:hypothetical protein